MTLDTSYRSKRLQRRLHDEEFRKSYSDAKAEIQQIDSIIRSLDERRVSLGMSKAELARRIGKNPASVRRLFTSQANPELSTVAAMAADMDVKIELKPIKRAPRMKRAATD